MPFKRLSRVLAIVLVPLLFAAGAQAEPARIVAFGDSLMAGYELGPGEGFPERLAEALRERGRDVEMTNASVSGDTTSGGLSRLDWSVPDGVDIVILELGGNDMLRAIPPAVTRANLDTMIASLKERGIRVLLAGMLAAPNLGQAYAAEFNAIYPDLARKHDVPLIPFILDGVAADARYLLADGIHPNPDGVERMVALALPHVEAMLAAD